MSGAIGQFRIGVSPIGGTFFETFTAQDMINQALKAAGLLGVGQTALAEDISDTFVMLNNMLAQWNRRRWLVWHLLDLGITTTGAKQYSVGIGQDYDIPRPDRIEGAYFVQLVNSQPNQVSFPLGLIQSMEDYAQIALKGLVSWPEAVFYDSAYPVGYVYPYPIPQSGQYELHILVKDTLQQCPTLTSAINMPPEYFEAIMANLALRLGAFYPGAVVTDDLRGIAKASLETIRTANAQIARLKMPTILVRPPLYNIFSGQVY